MQYNVPLNDRFRDQNLLELSSVTNHSTFYWNFVEASPFHPDLQNLKLRYEQDLHFIFKRLHPRNIMHNIHDDVLNMYFLLKEYLFAGSKPDRLPFKLNGHRILMIDPHGATDTTKPIQYLSSHPLRFKKYLTDTPDVVTCFRDAVVGQTKTTAWYQYGFKSPQGI